eukprot:CAMPEP_0196132616 /NCGR_PEP_ID=MMETSP0910-20130528/2164_1 /TAXON_ID=49265 /ORGANISM="Thalassiosira rotula, Strain GSO102" /LENGTH=35 /DNA_ID= /DNA_START= /DNA_END= /DNA_ORIENTATION=
MTAWSAALDGKSESRMPCHGGDADDVGVGAEKEAT